MKKIIFPALLTVAAFVGACSNEAEKQNKDAIGDLRNYVDSVSKIDSYDNERWTSIESGYQEKSTTVDAKQAELNESMKKDYEKIKADYEELKAKAQAQVVQNQNAYKVVLRNALFGEGVIGDDMGFGFMTAANAAATYDRFVNTVDANKDNYSREDWDEIKVLYEAMDTRKNEIEKELPKGDNGKIAGLKIKFAAIKATNRPGAKIDENSAAKENR
ncbi:MAG: DUF6565 domain-containing protein [Bacteroidota bacterium]